MATIKPLPSAPSVIAVTGLSSLADTASVSADTEQDNVSAGYIKGKILCRFTADAATTGGVEVYVLTGLSTGVLSTTAKLSNPKFIGVVELNGTTEVIAEFDFYDMEGLFWKPHFVNSSGAALTAATVEFIGINYTDQ